MTRISCQVRSMSMKDPTLPEASGERGPKRRILMAGAMVVVAAAAGVAVGAGWVRPGDEELPEMPATAEAALEAQPEPEHADGWRRELGEPLAKPDLELTDQDGQPYDLRARTDGTATLLFFGFTHCRDACPAQLAILASAVDELSAEERDDLEVVFVSVDPDRDTPQRLRSWLAKHDDEFVGLTGDLGEVTAAMEQLLMSAPRPEEHAEHEEYQVNHHSPFVAFHPDDDRAHTMYPFGMRPDNWREELPALIRGDDLTG